ncbi:MAG: hypothetical protein ACRBBT_05930 [Paracoccaceae bacterium]
MTSVEWEIPSFKPEAAVSVCQGPLFLDLAPKIVDLLGSSDPYAFTVTGLRLTRLPVLPDLTVIEAQLQTQAGPALAHVGLFDGQLVRLDDRLPVLDRALLQGADCVERSFAFSDWLDFVLLSCTLMRPHKALFQICRTREDYRRFYALSDDALADLPDPSELEFPVTVEADQPVTLYMTHSEAVFSVDLKLQKHGRLEMLDDRMVKELPPQRILPGRYDWLYRAEDVK